MPWNCMLKMFKMVNIMLCVLCHNKKIEKGSLLNIVWLMVCHCLLLQTKFHSIILSPLPAHSLYQVLENDWWVPLPKILFLPSPPG